MTSEPSKIVAGDSLEWRETLPDYPASAGWSLRYVIYNANASYPIQAVADGDGHVVSVAATDTASWSPGRYEIAGYVSHPDGRKKTIVTHGLIIEPDPAAITAGLDGRSFARRMLDAIEAALEGRADKGQLDMLRYQFGVRGGEINPEILMRARDRYQQEVYAEERAEKLARGEGTRGWRVRF